MAKNDPQAFDIRKNLNIVKKRSLFLRIWFWIAVLAVAGLAAGGVFWFAPNGQASYDFKTVEVKRGQLVVTVSATGNLEPVNQVDVGTEISGTIRTVKADYNDLVKAGQVLVEIDTDKLRAQVLQYQASVASAQAKVLDMEAQVMSTRTKLERLKKSFQLSGGKVPSEQDIEAAEAAAKSAQAQEAMARADIARNQALLEAAQSDLKKAVILSPIDGVVMKRSIEPGQTVSANLQTPVFFSLAEDLKKMQLVVDVDEADVGQVKEGQTATFTVDAYPNRTFPAKIFQVRYASQTVSGVVTYETLLEVDNSEMLLRPGMTATAEIIVSQVTDALIVPNSALRFAPPAVDGSGAAEGKSPLITSLMPRPPVPRNVTGGRPAGAGGPGAGQRPGGGPGAKGPGAGRSQRVFILQDGQPRPVMLTTGMTDGVNTVVLSGDIPEGAQVVVEAVKAKS